MPPDSILWVFLKERVYCNNPRILEDLKDKNESVLLALTNKFFEMWQETLKMANVCLQEGKKSFQNLL
jgi:hypothetical protein